MSAALPPESLEVLRDVLRLADEKNKLICLYIEFEVLTGLRYVDASQLTFDKIMINDAPRRSFTIYQQKLYTKRVKRAIERKQAAGEELTPKKLKTIESNAKQQSKITIHVGKELRDLIKRLYLVNGHNEVVFQSNHHHAKAGKAISRSYINQQLASIASELGLEYTLSTHSMRKMFAQILLGMEGVTIKHLKEALGHNDLSSTVHYINTFHNQTGEFVKDIKLR